VVIPDEVDIGTEVSSVDEFAGKKRMFFVAQNDSSRMPLQAESVDFVVTDPPSTMFSTAVCHTSSAAG
jgi:hypothetical protein